MSSFAEVTNQMADEATGTIVIGSLLNGVHPTRALSDMKPDGNLDPEFVEAAADEYQRRDPEGYNLVTRDEIAEAIYQRIEQNLSGDLPL